MARFRYRMQGILEVKMKLENQAKQEFAAAKIALDEEIEKLSAIQERKTAYEQEAKTLLQGVLRVQEISDNKAAILKMDEYIALQELEIKRAEEAFERAQQKLQEVMQERKMHEKLKEKAFDAFLEEEKKQEGKEVDELTSYTYGQRIADGNRKKE